MGGPEALHLEGVETPEPGEVPVLIKVELTGINYADTGVRRRKRFGPRQAEIPLTRFGDAGTVAELGEEGPAYGTRGAAVLEPVGGEAGTKSVLLVTLAAVG